MVENSIFVVMWFQHQIISNGLINYHKQITTNIECQLSALYSEPLYRLLHLTLKWKMYYHYHL